MSARGVPAGNHQPARCVEAVMNHDDDRAGLILAGNGHDPDDPAVSAAHDHVTAVLRAHRHLTIAPGRFRDWYRSTALAELPGVLDPD